MIDFDGRDRVSYVDRYKQRIEERKQRRSQEEYVSDVTETDLSPKNSLYVSDVTETDLTSKDLSFGANWRIQVSEKIEAVCILDKEFQEMRSFIDEANRRAESAVKTASDAAEFSPNFFNRKKAIEALQTSQREQALANESNTQGVTKLAMLQGKIIEAIRALFALGVGSIAANRSVYQQLELKMQGASEQELSDFARKEILDVMQQLNNQHDMMAKQEKLKSEVHQQQARIDGQEARIDYQDKKIAQLKADLKKIQIREEESARGTDNVQPDQAEKNQSPSDVHKDESEPTKEVPLNKTETDEQKKNVKKRRWSWSRKR